MEPQINTDSHRCFCNNVLIKGVLLLSLLFPWQSLEAGTPDKQSPPAIQCWFGPAASDDPKGPFYNFMRFMETARHSVYFAIHDLTLFAVAKKLVELKQRGVQVQGLLEADYLDGADNQLSLELLKSHGIPCKTHTPAGLMHNKYVIIDRKRVWTGSANFTERGYFFHYNDTLWIENKKVANHYLGDFKRLVDIRGYRKGGTLGKRYSFSLGEEGESVEIYFSPVDQPTRYLVQAIEHSKQDLHFLIFAYSSAAISAAMGEAHNQGVSIKGVFDNSFASPRITSRWNTVPYKVLKRQGVNVIYDDEKAKVHHKMMVIDGDTVVTGSFNFSKNAEKRNNENVLIIHSPLVAEAYDNRFRQLWERFPHASLRQRYFAAYETALKKNPSAPPFWDTYKKKYYRREIKRYRKLMDKGQFTGTMRRAFTGDTIRVEVGGMDSYITVKLAGVIPPFSDFTAKIPLQEPAATLALQEVSLLANQKPVRVLVLWELDDWLTCEGIVYFSTFPAGKTKAKESPITLNEMMLKKGWGYFSLEEELKHQSKRSPFYRFAIKCKKAFLAAKKFKRGIWSEDHALEETPWEHQARHQKKGPASSH